MTRQAQVMMATGMGRMTSTSGVTKDYEDYFLTWITRGSYMQDDWDDCDDCDSWINGDWDDQDKWDDQDEFTGKNSLTEMV